jgi:hypothetical protein
VRDQIFISYRRDDARGASGRLYDWLRIAFGRDRVFRDVQSIGVGNWRAKIDDALARSAVFVAVIGPRWADAANLPRLHEEADLVRYEVTRALADGELTVVPTLVEGAAVPKPGILPAALQPMFASWNARHVSEDGWESDLRRLVAEIGDASGLRKCSSTGRRGHGVCEARDDPAWARHDTAASILASRARHPDEAQVCRKASCRIRTGSIGSTESSTS